MGVTILVQRDYFDTEATISPSSSVSEVHDLLRATKTSGRMIVLYNDGHVQAINVEQNKKISDAKSNEIRKLLDLDTKTL